MLPLLDLVESGEEGYGDEDDDGFLAVADLELPFSRRQSYFFATRVYSLLLSGQQLTSRADTNCKGRSALFMSAMLVSRS